MGGPGINLGVNFYNGIILLKIEVNLLYTLLRLYFDLVLYVHYPYIVIGITTMYVFHNTGYQHAHNKLYCILLRGANGSSSACIQISGFLTRCSRLLLLPSL